MEEKDENSNNLNIFENLKVHAIPPSRQDEYSQSRQVNVISENLDMSMESSKRQDVQSAELGNQLRKLETETLVSKEKITFLEEKIKDKDDIIHALKVSLDLYKNTDQSTAKEYKAQISKQAAIIKIQEEKLAKLEAEKKFSKGMLHAKKNDNKESITTISQQENIIKQLKQNIDDLKSSRQSEMKSGPDMLKNKVPLEYKGQISTQAALIKDLEEKLAKLELEGKTKKALLRSSQVKIGQLENTIKQLKQSIADLKTLNEQNSGSKATLEGLHLRLQSYQDRLEENEKLLDSYKAQLKERDDQITLLELGNNLDSFKMKEKDDLLQELQKRMAKLN